jgi:hypothetical protein
VKPDVGPDQVPDVAVNVWPTMGSPDTVGRDVLSSVCPLAAPLAIAATSTAPTASTMLATTDQRAAGACRVDFI